MDPKDVIFYYESEARKVPIFGSSREISLAENIIKVLPSSMEKVLDVGCGEGYLLFKIRKKYGSTSIYGLDLSNGRIRKTKEKVSKVVLLRGDVISLPFPDDSFDVVICSELLEHVPKYKNAIGELVRVSKKNIIITVPNEQPLKTIICPKCKTKHYLDGHINFFRERKLESLFKKRANMKITKIRKFHTIYSYNKLTLKFPLFLRLFFDQSITLFHKPISFLKPNFLMIVLEKMEKTEKDKLVNKYDEKE